MSIRIFLGLMLSVATASAAVAEPIAITSHRSISGFVSFVDATGLGASMFDGAVSSTSGPFKENRVVTDQTELGSLSVATSQDTDFDAFANRLTGSGSISAGPNSVGGIGEVLMSSAISELSLSFTLARATLFRFSGVLTSADSGTVQASIEGPDAFAFSGPIVNERGVLQPGSYLFFTRAALGENIPSLTGSAAFNIDFRLDAAQTPEPSSLLLVATGVIAALGGRRRLQRRSDAGV